MSDEAAALLEFLYLVPVGIVRMDGTGRVTMLNPEASRLLVPLSANLDNLIELLGHYDDELRSLLPVRERDAGLVLPRRRLPLGDAGSTILELSVVKLRRDDFIAVVQDGTEQARQELELRKNQETLRAIFDGIHGYAVHALDRLGRITNWNRSGQRLLGYESRAVEEQPLSSLFERGAEPDELASLLAEATRRGAGQRNGPMRHASGQSLWATTIVSSMRDDSDQPIGFAVVTRDDTALRIRERELEERAEKDPMTKLANRRAFDSVLAEATVEHARSQVPLSLVMVDIDHFKQVNDEHGHQTGDAVIKEVAQVLANAGRGSDTAARVGGEEFAILLPKTPDRGAQVLAERIRGRVEQLSVQSEGKSLSVTVSLGVAQAEVGESAESLYRRADAALYRAKKAGRNQVVTASGGD